MGVVNQFFVVKMDRGKGQPVVIVHPSLFVYKRKQDFSTFLLSHTQKAIILIISFVLGPFSIYTTRVRCKSKANFIQCWDSSCKIVSPGQKRLAWREQKSFFAKYTNPDDWINTSNNFCSCRTVFQRRKNHVARGKKWEQQTEEITLSDGLKVQQHVSIHYKLQIILFVACLLILFVYALKTSSWP